MAIRQEAPPTHLGLRDVNFREHLKVLKLVGASIMDPEHEPYDARQWQANLLRLALVDIRCAVPSARPSTATTPGPPWDSTRALPIWPKWAWT